MKQFKNILALSCLLLASSNYSMQPNQPKGHVVALPIDATRPQGQCLNLQITVPKDFKSLQFALQASAIFGEFIPQKEEVGNWTEMITLYGLLKEKRKAGTFKEDFKDRFKQLVLGTQILEEQLDKQTNTAEVIIKYRDHNRDEIVLMKSYAGLYDLASFQYAVALSQTLNQVQAIEKIKTFAQNNVKVIKF